MSFSINLVNVNQDNAEAKLVYMLGKFYSTFGAVVVDKAIERHNKSTKETTE